MPYILNQDSGEREFMTRDELGYQPQQEDTGTDLTAIKKIIGQQILAQPNLKLNEVDTALGYLEGPKEDTGTKKRKLIINQAVPVLNQVFKYAASAPEGWKGWTEAMKGKIPGYDGGDAEQLDRVTDGFARLIASAFASEVGVATDRDVARWKRLMPQPGDTLAERQQRVNDLVTQVNLESKGIGVQTSLKVPKSFTKKKGQTSSVPGVPSEIKAMTTSVPPKQGTGMQSTQQSTEQPGQTKSLGDLNLLQRILGTNKDTLDVNIPGGNALSEIGSLAGSFLPLSPGVRTAIGGAVGQTAENINQKGIPLTQKGAEAYTPENPAMAALGPLGILLGSPGSRQMAGQVAPAALLDMILSGHKVLGNLRGGEANRLTNAGTTIPGKEIATPLVEDVTKKLGPSKQLIKKTSEITQKYAGEQKIPDLLNRRSYLGDISRKVGGDIKSTTTGLLGDKERELISKAIKQRSTLISALDKLDTILYGAGRGLGTLAKVGTVGAAGAGGAYLYGKLFGR